MRHPGPAVALLALVASLLAPRALAADPPRAAPARAETPRGAPLEMEAFQLVLLVRAPTWRQLPRPEAEALQAAHLAHLTRMSETGKAGVCGPFSDQRDEHLRGACIYRVASAGEARALAEEDPVVKAGQLRIEAVTWWVGKGWLAFPRAPPEPTR